MDKQENKQTNVFAKMEEEVLDFWEKSKIFEKSVKKEAPNGDYVFYDGPPFATGLPHYGHIVASLIKDTVPRYWTMKGYRVERKWGWDCHGLPIENIVEKELGSKNKKDIEELGVAKFNELCRTKVTGYVDDWKKIIKKIGRWADMENDYKTMDLEFMESVWHVFKTMYENDLIYKGYRSMHVCPRCETTLSQSEVTEGYKDIKDLSCIAKFELVEEPNTFVLAWTTTPWTLIGNVALAVGGEIDYIIIENTFLLSNGNPITPLEIETPTGSKIIKEKYILAKNQYDNLKDKFKESHKIIKKIKGFDLVGKKYKPLFDYYANDENLENKANAWKIYTGDFVTTEDGTGIVHIAPAFGDDDMKLGKENSLPFVQHLTMDGNFKKEVKDFFGLNVKQIGNHMATDIEIIKYLANHNLLFSKEKYEHSYPHCWRCDTPLLNYATSSWFVNVTKIKNQLLENAKTINWSPEHIKNGRWGNWLEGARDWSISRQRFWASVMPIWECDCGERKVIGSIAELEELSGKKVTDLHKHIVDEITFPCQCGKEMKRIPDVLDTWFDSGSMPFAQMHYPFENKEKFENNFPAEFIAEGTDQTRCWFYYMHVLATGTKNTNAFNNVIVNGIVLAEDGKKMSKKLQNYPDPAVIVDQYSADALRYYLLTSPVMLADNLNFSEKGVQESLRKINMILWNVVKFYEMFENDLKDENEIVDKENVLDRWIIYRLYELIKEVTENMNSYNLPGASRPISKFIDDLSTWYIRRSRDRFKGEDEADKQSALQTTKYVLLELSKIIAPFMPFIAEQVWQKITNNNFQDQDKSVHLEAWSDLTGEDEEIIKKGKEVSSKMNEIKKIIELALAKRDEEKIKIRQPLNKLTVNNSSLKIDNDYLDLIKDEVNIKEIEIKEGQGNLEVELDLEITQDLKLEGLKREIVRFINSIRKETGLTINDNVVISYETKNNDLKNAFEKFENEIKKETLALEMKEGIDEGFESRKEVKVNGENLVIGLLKK